MTRAAAAACALAFALCLAAAWDASRLDPLPRPRAADDPAVPAARSEPADLPARLVLAAAARDPFRADRRRPAARYGESVPASGAVASISGLRLLGTAAWPGDGTSGVAAIQVTGQPPRVIRVGQTVEGLRLLGVASGVATFAGRDTTVVLRLAP